MARAGWDLEKLRSARAREPRARRQVRRRQASRSWPRSCATSTATTRIPQTFQQIAQGARARRSARSIISRFRRACSAASCRASRNRAARKNARVIVEKPFGRDLATAQALDATLHEVFPEESIFRIDHYLGKEAVQNLLYFRFANTFLEPIWNRHYVQGRADHHGRDLRRPGPRRVLRGSRRDPRRGAESSAAGDLAARHGSARRATSRGARQAEKLRLFRAMRPLDPKEVVRGQFRGYRDEKGVAKDSQVETFAALQPAHRHLALGGRAVLHPRGQVPADHAPPRCASRSRVRRSPSSTRAIACPAIISASA